MKKLFLFVLAIAACEFCGYASTVGSRPDSLKISRKYWFEGPLEYGDFTQKKSADGTMDLVCSFDYERRDGKADNTNLDMPFVSAYMKRDDSWFDPDYMTKERLALAQIVFDYAEVCNRRAQDELLYGDYEYAEDVVDEYLSKASDFYDKIDRATDGARDTLALRFYADSVKTLLDNTRLPDLYEMRKTSRLSSSICGYAGYQHESYQDFLGNKLTGFNGVGFGTYLEFGRLVLFGDCFIGAGKALSSTSIPLEIYNNDKLGALSYSVSAGLSLGKGLGGRFTPFFGVGGAALSIEDIDDQVSGFRTQWGVNIVLVPSRHVYISGGDDWIVSETTIQAKLYMARTTFDGCEDPCTSINFSLCVGFGMGSAKARRK